MKMKSNIMWELISFHAIPAEVKNYMGPVSNDEKSASIIAAPKYSSENGSINFWQKILLSKIEFYKYL